MNVFNTICDRCKTETNITTMSMMNTDTICLECKDKETQHPRYKEARDAELAEVKRGNHNYPGLFAGQKYPF